jgi:hypothetical protein
MADVQIAVIDPEDTQLALAAPAEAVVNVAVPGVQGPIGLTGSVAIAQDGTATEPGIRFESDTNTGIYRPGADQLAISTNGTGRLYIASDGKVGLGVASPGGTFHASKGGTLPTAGGTEVGIFQWNSAIGNTSSIAIVAGTGASSELYFGDSDDINVGFIRYEHPNNALVFATNTAERARIDSSGRLLVGTSSALGSVGAGAGSLLQIANGNQVIGQYSANLNGGFLELTKSRNATAGSHTVVQSGDQLGIIRFSGSDGSSFVAGAEILCSVDGTPGTNDMPGRLVFSTTADGAASPTERLRITSAGVLQIADAGNITVGTTTGTKIGTATTQKIGFFDKTPVVQPTAVADATDAATVITQLNALLTRMRNLGLIAT